MSERTAAPTVLTSILRGKLGAVDGYEDLLTAAAFGTLSWLPPSVGGWKESWGSTCTAYFSYSVDNPGGWMVEQLCRWYVPIVPPPVAYEAYVSVVLCPRRVVPDVPPFEEPLVSAGWFRYAGSGGKGGYRKWLAGRIQWVNVPRDGTFDHVQLPEPDDVGIVEARSMGLPLVRIATSDDLRTFVIEPLLDVIPIRSEGSADEAEDEPG